MFVIILKRAFFLILAGMILLPRQVASASNIFESKLTQAKKTSHFKPGEQIVYDVKLGKVTLGKAKFNHVALTSLNGRPVMHITFETRMANFKDQEKIFSDIETDLPLKVEREISTWPSPEKITEEYDQEKFILTVKKFKGHKKEEVFTIKKSGPIQNAILLPFSVRNAPKLSVGWSMQVNLPTQEFRIKLVSIEEIKVPSGKFSAYHFESEPKKLEIWISADNRRIPLKITGTGNLGYTLLMREYSGKVK
ncbi:MAG: DUF3108 domain-containing protein [Candidatus Omnitrophica bacterium]|nr:DUF3108 domain-containing protein [Candidatus Omnitrophota bacterium]